MVQEAGVEGAFCFDIGRGEKTELREAVVDADEDDLVPACGH